MGLIGSCSNDEKEVTIFSIPSTATPNELAKNGFDIIRDLNVNDQKDQSHNGEIDYCYLDLKYATIRASYPEGDSSELEKYEIRIDCKPFEKMTDLEAKTYSSVEIDGYNYHVQLSDNKLYLEIERLGL